MTFNYRLYGRPPYATILVHGGPGAAGEMDPVAEELPPHFGVIEALQKPKSFPIFNSSNYKRAATSRGSNVRPGAIFTRR